MRGLKRIALIAFFLIGGAAAFGYWSTNQFNQAIDDLSSLYLANTQGAYISFDKLDNKTTSTSVATSTVSELSFVFPENNTEVYMGCTYLISWQSSTTIDTLETVLIDAGTGESVGPVPSGLAKENRIEKERQNLEWTVGFVWPGAYYIKISKINGTETKTKSRDFVISRMPKDISVIEQKNICMESGGIF